MIIIIIIIIIVIIIITTIILKIQSEISFSQQGSLNKNILLIANKYGISI